MISKYNDYIIESLILESKLEFSEKLLNLISSMPDNKVKNELIKLNSDKDDLNLLQNYFDISDTKDEITFVPDKRANQILGEDPIKFITFSGVSGAYLTINKRDGEYVNKTIFDALNVDLDTMKYVVPDDDVIGDILSETPSRKVPGKIYVLFKWGDDKYCVLNKQFVGPHDDRYNMVWSLSKNKIRVGRGIKALLKNAGIETTEKEIEDFVNLYKSTFDIMNNEFLKFKIVSGAHIAYWYNGRNYENSNSTLGGSCMAEVDSDYFDIYVENPEVCKLVILFSNNGTITDGVYKSDKIRGRALLWKTDEGDMLMDRIYYNYESDVDLFKQYAEKNNWWCKKYQDSTSNFTAQKGANTKKPRYTITLKRSDFDYYPYVDTFTYISFDENELSNYGNSDTNAELNDTGGTYDSYWHDD